MTSIKNMGVLYHLLGITTNAYIENLIRDF